MRYQRNRFETIIQDTNSNNRSFLEEEFKSILESNRAYASKCDYIGYSILSIDDKIKLLDEELNYIKSYKSKLKEAKQIVQEVGAKVFSDYGITKIEGGGISSITYSNEITKKKLVIESIDEAKLIEGGFYKKVIDKEMLLDSYIRGEYLEFINKYSTIKVEEVTTPSKLRVNKRRVANNLIEQPTKEEVA